MKVVVVLGLLAVVGCEGRKAGPFFPPPDTVVGGVPGLSTGRSVRSESDAGTDTNGQSTDGNDGF